MPNESRKCSALCLFFLFTIGVLVGISIDAKFRPNHILFWVNAGQDLSLRFLPGDRIEWSQLVNGNPTPVAINFLGDSVPCVGGKTNPCIVDRIPDTATYYYTCTAQDGTNCNDPQAGPRSGTQGFEGPGFLGKILDLIENIFALFSQVFNHSQLPGTPGITHNSAGRIAASQAKIIPAASPTYPNIYPELSCNAPGVTHVSVFGQNDDLPIHAHVGQNILWGTSSEKGFTVTTDPSTCQIGSTFGPNGKCVAANSGNYTATAPPCTTNNSESIAVP